MDNQTDGMIFVSVDGDNLGREVGGAILSDDIQRLHEVSQSINHGQNLLMDWAENNGGQVISSGGDEGIFQVPESALDSLEDLRSQYHQMVGSTLTIGVGLKPSEAGKALLYGKLNGKDQVNQFHPEMDDFLMEAHQHAESGGGTKEERKQDEAYLSDMYEDDGQEHPESDDYSSDQEDQYADAQDSADDQLPEGYELHEDSFDDEHGQDMDGEYNQELHPEVSDAMQTVGEAGVQEGSDEDQDASMKDAMKDEMSYQPESSLKQKLGEVLESFKTDKGQLEQMNSENPEMYSEVVQLLQQMIRVAKMLSSTATPEYEETPVIDQQQDVSGEEVGKQIP